MSSPRRPALSLKQLTYKPEEGLVRYQVLKTNGGPSYYEWPAAEFVGRAAVTAATQGRASSAELEAGYGVTWRPK